MEAMLFGTAATAGGAAATAGAIGVGGAFSAWQALSTLGMVSGVMGAISQGNTAADNYEQSAAMNDYNAAVARNQSTSALSESAAAQSAQRRRAREVLGEQRAGIAQSGTGFGGSNADLMEQSQTLAELDALNLAYEGDMKSKSYISQASIEDVSAATNRRNVGTARTSGYIGAGRALLVGAGSYGQGRNTNYAPVATATPRLLGG